MGFASYYLEDNCRCGTQVPANLIITHELGHAMAYYHTMPYTTSVMSYLADPALLRCAAMGFSDLDRYHASLAYARSIGNVSPDTDPTSFQFQRAGGRRSTENRFSCPLPGGGF